MKRKQNTKIGKRTVYFTKADFKAAARYVSENNHTMAQTHSYKQLKQLAYDLMEQLLADDTIDSLATAGFFLTKSVDSNAIDIDIYVCPRFPRRVK
jgi:hypothetical protein